ncbi:dihydropyrimidine dehydrogenase [Brenneria goodwinii]|uniref:Dihydropyrimidine dehydrogenase n=1 Tax=Brenneria goodwinii TaxID=1109412 RepID=A0A0G4JTJ1_9GAMM|nr:NAD(P)-dependent oxidoreductase [Brenneria goodwinii]ATA26050.1 dihydropyrimidine dehydrogenase [Brenneria goodwinii]RLM18729.1 dihydropyrimidine dehydrogenase [Brenneria goodwinii]CPR15737.1 Pyridine nucleotide-disulphide oxidoreductase associated with reductive pyrimidine catabolism [Brenneria goodwinii]
MKTSLPPGVDTPGIQSGRLSAAEYADNFSDSVAPLTNIQAVIEAERCYYCYDAPCTRSCPADINVPSFIHRIAQENVRGAAQAILSENVLGGMCARVCPTETLCEQSCVRNQQDGKPVRIGLLQRYATDAYLSNPGQPLFTRATSTGKKVAVVGAGPAGLTAAHRLARCGHQVVVFDAREKPGGLNEYGLASYKTTDDFAQREIAWLLSIGGIELRLNQRLGRDISLDRLRADYDAVFLAMGLGGVNALGIEGEPLEGVREAVDFIAELRQASHPGEVAIGRNVVVIGGGMTAVDAAVQAKKLGAREVTMVYRRGEADMKASPHEQEWAKANGVTIRHWAAPLTIHGENNCVTGVSFMVMQWLAGALVASGENFTLPADMVLKAIGQTYDAGPTESVITLKGGRIATDEEGRTSLPGVWAGGDCCADGLDLTVDAVRQGKAAAASIDAVLRPFASHPVNHNPSTTDREYSHG